MASLTVSRSITSTIGSSLALRLHGCATLAGSARPDISPPGGQDNPHRILSRLRHARAAGAQISEPRGDGEYCCLKRRMRNVLLCERAAREISRGMRLPGGAPMTDYTYDFVNVRVRDGVAWAALNRPE